MAKTPMTVQDFEEDLTIKLLESGKEELETLTKLKQDETNDPNAVINSWDKSFYTNILKEKFYSIDEEVIKEYFPTNNVVDVTMEIYQELLGLKF
jgi:Zn-dependent oligopeptidase